MVGDIMIQGQLKTHVSSSTALHKTAMFSLSNEGCDANFVSRWYRLTERFAALT